MRKVPLYAHPDLIASYIVNDDNFSQQMGLTWTGQTFLNVFTTVAKTVRIKAFRTLLPGNVTMSIRATVAGKPAGADLGLVTVDADLWTPTSPGVFQSFVFFPAVALSSSTTYAIVFRAPTGDGSNFTTWRSDATAPGYTGGSNAFSTDGGVTWTLNTATDMMFQVLGG